MPEQHFEAPPNSQELARRSRVAVVAGTIATAGFATVALEAVHAVRAVYDNVIYPAYEAVAPPMSESPTLFSVAVATGVLLVGATKNREGTPRWRSGVRKLGKAFRDISGMANNNLPGPR